MDEEDGRAVPKYDLGAIDKVRNSGRETEAVTRAKMRENGTKIALLLAYFKKMQYFCRKLRENNKIAIIHENSYHRSRERGDEPASRF